MYVSAEHTWEGGEHTGFFSVTFTTSSFAITQLMRSLTYLTPCQSSTASRGAEK